MFELYDPNSTDNQRAEQAFRDGIHQTASDLPSLTAQSALSLVERRRPRWRGWMILLAAIVLLAGAGVLFYPMLFRADQASDRQDPMPSAWAPVTSESATGPLEVSSDASTLSPAEEPVGSSLPAPTLESGFRAAGVSRLSAAPAMQVSTFAGSGGNDVLSSVASLDDGGVFAFGTTDSNDGDFEGMNPDAPITAGLRVTSSARGKVSLTIDSRGQQSVLSATSSGDNAVIVAGPELPVAGGAVANGVARLNARGDVEWTNGLDSAVLDFFTAVAVAKDGSIVAAGKAGSNARCVLARFSPAGALDWMKDYGACPAYFSGVAVGADNSIYAAGSIDAGGIDGAVLARFDEGGTPEWVKAYGSTMMGEFKAVQVTPDDNLVVAGYTDVGNSVDATLAEIDPQGEVVWGMTYGGAGDDRLNGVTVTHDGQITVAGATSSADGSFFGTEPVGGGSENTAGVVARFTAEGVMKWSRLVSVGEADHLYGIDVDARGRVVAVGETGSITDGVIGNDALLVQFASEK